MQEINRLPTPLAGMVRAGGPMPDPFVLPIPNPFELLRDSLMRVYAGVYPTVPAELVAVWIDAAFQRTIGDLIDAVGTEKNLSTSNKEKKSWVV
jgi:hypothetical protein